jgi:nitrite reductase (NO-forming)
MIRLATKLLAASAIMVLSACGSSGASPAAGGSGGGGVQVAVDAQNFQFTPSTITVKPGDKVTVTVSNKDSFEHNFSISDLTVSQDVAANATQMVSFTATSSNLQFFCKYHKAKGMVGTLDVGAANSVPSAPASAPSPAATYSKYPAY